MEPLITTDQVYEALRQGIDLMWSNIEPIIMPIIYENLANAVVVFVVGLVLFKIWQFIHIDASKREEKRARKVINNGVDVVFSIFDLFKE